MHIFILPYKPHNSSPFQNFAIIKKLSSLISPVTFTVLYCKDLGSKLQQKLGKETSSPLRFYK